MIVRHAAPKCSEMTTGVPPTEENVKVGSVIKLKISEQALKTAFNESLWYIWDGHMRVLLGQTVTVCDRPRAGFFGLPECEKGSGQNIWWYPLSVIEHVIPTLSVPHEPIDRLPPDLPSELLVSGYFHNFQKAHKDIVIPIDLITVCLHYYHRPEYFEHCSNNIKLSENHLSVSMNSVVSSRALEWKNTNYGHMVIPTVNNEHIYKWHLKMVHHPFSMMIGISSKDTLNSETDFCRESKDAQYGYWTSCGQIEHNSRYEDYGETLLNGDILCMELDLKHKTLRFARNGRDYGIAYENIATGESLCYRLALSIGFEGTASLVNFERIKGT